MNNQLEKAAQDIVDYWYQEGDVDLDVIHALIIEIKKALENGR